MQWPYDPVTVLGSQDLCSHKNLYLSVYSSFTHNSPKPEATQMSFDGCTNKHTVVHPYHAILLGKERNELLIHVTPGMNLQRIMLSAEKRSPQRLHTYDSNFITFEKMLPTTKSMLQMRSGCQRLRRWESGREVGMDVKGQLCGDENVQYLDRFNVNIWAVILYSGFATCDHWRD